MIESRPSMPLSPETVGATSGQVACIYFVDDFQMARQYVLEQGNRPLLQRLGEQRVIGVANVWRVTCHAVSQSSTCSSTSKRISSATAIAGCVSLS